MLQNKSCTGRNKSIQQVVFLLVFSLIVQILLKSPMSEY